MPDLSNYQFGSVPLNLLDYVKSKPKSSKYYFQYLFARTQKMFEYKNLPDTIDSDVLERYLQLNGATCITRVNSSLYCFAGSVGGEQDVYYKPSLFVVSNPHLDGGFSKNIIITPHLDEFKSKLPNDSQPGVLIRNDTEWIGLTPLIARYAVLMAENTLTIRSADIMLRIIALITASSDKTLRSAQDYLKRLENGELGAIGDSQFSEGIKMQSPPSNNGSYLTQFIELQQYLKGSFFGELGLQANYNMKREAIGKGESTMDTDALLPLCDNMLMCRRQDMERVNSLYGTSIEVNFSSAWLRSHIENDVTMISQLVTTGLANVGENESTRDDGSSTGDDSTGNESGATGGESGATRGESGARETDVENSETGKDKENLKDEEPNREDGRTGESSEDTGEKDRSDQRDDGSSEGNDEHGNGDCESAGCEINNLGGEEVVDKVEELVEDLCDKLEAGTNNPMMGMNMNGEQNMKGGEENGFLGQTESSGDQKTDTDD